MGEKLVVTRHQALVKYLVKHGFIAEDTEHISYATKEDVQGKHVYGILPNWLACHAEKLTEVQLRLPPNKRGVELTLEDIEASGAKPRTYIIRKADKED